MLQHCDTLEVDDLEKGDSRILAWLTISILGQQTESVLGASSVLETKHPRDT